MKPLMLRAFLFLTLGCFAVVSASHAADMNPPSRLTVELRDGSRVVGTSVEKYFKFHSALLGHLKLTVEDIRSIDCVSSNSAKLTTTGGDTLTVSFVDSDFAVKTSFGKVELAASFIRRLSVSVANHAIRSHEGLVALWSGEDNANDSLGNNHGFPVGALAYGDGKIGHALKFNQTTSYITVPASASLDIGTGSGLTIECWVKPVAGVNAPIIEWDSATTDGLQLWVANGNTQLFANLKDTSGVNHIIAFNYVFSTDSFQHIAVTYDKGSGRVVLYINGASVAAVNVGNITPQTTYPVNIGRRTGQPVGNGDTFGGLIDELSLYNRAVSATEIREAYEAGNILN